MTLGALGGAVKPLSRAEILALPPWISLADLGRVFGISEPTARRRQRSGDWEALGIRICRLGQQYRVITSTVHAVLGIHPDGQVSGANPEASSRIAAGQRRPTASALRLATGQNAPS
jgi:hypothetical protein